MSDNMFENIEKAFLESWEAHRKAFGPILDPAFQENPQVRIKLTAALNHISRRETKRGYEILQSLKDQCIYNEDKAAWAFFVGLCFEMSGVTEQMLLWYEQAGKYGHMFYLPYLKIAKAAFTSANFDIACKNYAKGIECLINADKEFQNNAALASAYLNLCSCLTSMHLYSDAAKALESGQKYNPPPASYATAAILYAAMNDKEKVDFYISELKKEQPILVDMTNKTTNDILSGVHPHFCALAIDERRINDFWAWFTKNQNKLTRKLREDENSEAIEELSKQIKAVFPFLDRTPKLTVKKDGIRLNIILADSYAISLHCGYGELISACPKEILDHFTFILVH